MAIALADEVEALSPQLKALKISSKPLFSELLAQFEGKKGSLQSLLTLLKEALPTLSGEEIMAGIVSILALHYSKVPSEKMHLLMQVYFVVAPHFFSETLRVSSFEGLASETDWWRKALVLVHRAKTKEEIVSFCLDLLREILPNDQLKVRGHLTVPDTPLHPVYVVNGCPLRAIGAAYLFCYRFVELLDTDEDTDQVLKTIFYKQASMSDVQTENIFAAATLYAFVWSLLLNRNHAETLFMDNPGKDFPPEKFVSEVRSFIVNLHNASLSGLSQLSTTKALLHEIFQESSSSHGCLQPLKYLTIGNAHRDDFSWVQQLDLFGHDLFCHYLGRDQFDGDIALQMVPEIFQAGNLLPETRIELVQQIVAWTIGRSFSIQRLPICLVAICRFIGSLPENDKTFASCLKKCLCAVDLLIAHGWKYDDATLVVEQETMERLKKLERLYNKKQGCWIDKIASKAIKSFVKEAVSLVAKTRGEHTNFSLIEQAVRRKNEILQVVQAYFKDLSSKEQTAWQKTFLSLSFVHLSSHVDELHLFQIDNQIFIETVAVFCSKKPILTKKC